MQKILIMVSVSYDSQPKLSIQKIEVDEDLVEIEGYFTTSGFLSWV